MLHVMNGRVSMKYTKNLVQIMLYSREKRFTGIGTINYAVKRIKNCHWNFLVICTLHRLNYVRSFMKFCAAFKKELFNTIYCIQGILRPVLFSSLFTCKRYRPDSTRQKLYLKIDVLEHWNLPSLKFADWQQGRKWNGANISLYTVSIND